eukprot:XP_011431418.1 PREDICTED: E3 ubiquitin-protein ligase Midline-1-like [Crassostrea gigas]
MDPKKSAQDVYRCNLCETAMVYSYCDMCHVNLCMPCIGDHISDGYHKHEIVPFTERRSTLIYPKCETHQHKICEYQCENCNAVLVCSFCIASEQHRGHKFAEVSEVYMAKKEVIKKDTAELENLITPMYEEIALDLERQLANLDERYEKLATTVSKQGEEWHREMDIVINSIKKEISETQVKHRAFLQKHLDEIKQIQSIIKQTVIDLLETEKSNQVPKAIEYSSKNREFSERPPKIQISLPTFIPKPIDNEKLNALFGQIIPLSSATEVDFLSPNQSNTSVKELLDESELVTTIQTEYEKLTSATYINEDSVWVSGWSNDIKCFNIKGLLLQTIKTKSGNFPSDIAVDGGGDLLYISSKTQSVNKVRNEQTEELIRLQKWTPLNLCVTSTDDILITMYSDDQTQSKVVRYSGSTEKQTIQFDEEGKPLYSGNCLIKFITENRNYDICLADWGDGAIVVVNQYGKLNWRYTGQPSVKKSKLFRPFGITTDSKSRILASDSDNHCIHILDHNGHFLCCIDNCDLKDPYGLCVDNIDNLFVCEFFKGNVIKIKYLK